MAQYLVLDNGLRLIIDKRDLPTVGIAIGAGIGSIYEDKELRGISHLAEHIIYRNYPNIDLEIEGLGGISDAYTERSLTMYLFEVIPSELKNLLKLIHKIFGGRNISKEDLEKERSVVLSEFRMRSDDPSTLIYDLGMKALFGDSDYGDPIIGTEESITSIDIKDMKEFLESYYTPDNIVLSIVGPVNMSIEEITEIFNKWEGKAKPKKTPTISKGKSITINKNIDSAYLSYSWYIPLENKDPYLYSIKSSLLEFHLINGLSSYLISRFRNKGFSYVIDMDRDYLFDVYYYQIIISAVDKNMVDQVRGELNNALLNIDSILNDEYYLNKRLNYLKYLISDYTRRPLQIAESMTYMEIKFRDHDTDKFNKLLQEHFRDRLSELIRDGVWSMILPQ
ncbi:MAG: M16 family metallopeptidase [Vulcanisaeta sp. AZ3]|jgi:predicted Zn-dependent peptidase